MVQPWDKQAVGEVEKSILKSDIGLVPNNDGTNIRINMPELTEERRKDLAKIVRQKSEEARVSVRNIRRDTLERIRSMEKNKILSADDSKQFQVQLQKLTDQHIGNMDDIADKKEAEIMEV
jgi:ribosome recycling factor